MDDKKKITKYQTMYLAIGMSLGMLLGSLYGTFLFDGKVGVGLCLGLSTGMCLGMAIGAQKDKRLSEQMMEVKRIDETTDSADLLVYTVGKDGTEKEYRVTQERQKEEMFAVGDRVAEEKDGMLVSLETKEPEPKKKKKKTK